MSRFSTLALLPKCSLCSKLDIYFRKYLFFVSKFFVVFFSLPFSGSELEQKYDSALLWNTDVLLFLESLERGVLFSSKGVQLLFYSTFRVPIMKFTDCPKWDISIQNSNLEKFNKSELKTPWRTFQESIFHFWSLVVRSWRLKIAVKMAKIFFFSQNNLYVTKSSVNDLDAYSLSTRHVSGTRNFGI